LGGGGLGSECGVSRPPQHRGGLQPESNSLQDSVGQRHEKANGTCKTSRVDSWGEKSGTGRRKGRILLHRRRSKGLVAVDWGVRRGGFKEPNNSFFGGGFPPAMKGSVDRLRKRLNNTAENGLSGKRNKTQKAASWRGSLGVES